MNNKITMEINLCQEDRDRLDKIYATLEGMARTQSAPQTSEAEPVKETDQLVEKAPQNEQEAAAPWDKDAPDLPAVAEEPPAVKHSMEDVQQKVVTLAAAGKKAEVKEIVNAYAERVSAIPEDKLDEVMTKLIALEG